MVYVVTGGTSCIGKQICKDLCALGHKVVTFYAHDDKKASQTQKEFEKLGFELEIIKCDVSNEEDVKTAFIQVEKKFKKINGLVNNAGTNVDEFVETCNLQSYKNVIETNFIGKMLCSKYAIPLLKKQKNASIVHIASRMAARPDTECSAYCCSESAIITLSQCLALELASYGIRSNCVSPSLVLTPLAKKGWSKEEITDQEASCPRGRLAKMEDVSNAVLFLLGDKADFINGENIGVNGGSLIK